MEWGSYAVIGAVVVVMLAIVCCGAALMARASRNDVLDEEVGDRLSEAMAKEDAVDIGAMISPDDCEVKWPSSKEESSTDESELAKSCPSLSVPPRVPMLAVTADEDNELRSRHLSLQDKKSNDLDNLGPAKSLAPARRMRQSTSDTRLQCAATRQELSLQMMDRLPKRAPVGTPASDRAGTELFAYDVFLSYRRADGQDLAGRIFGELTFRHQLSCFYDRENLPGGEFSGHLFAAIKNSYAFVPVITPMYFDAVRMANPEDFCRREIETALARGLLVVPVVQEGYNPQCFSDFEAMPDSIKGLFDNDIVSVSNEYFSSGTIMKLKEKVVDHMLPKQGDTSSGASPPFGDVPVNLPLPCPIPKGSSRPPKPTLDTSSRDRTQDTNVEAPEEGREKRAGKGPAQRPRLDTDYLVDGQRASLGSAENSGSSLPSAGMERFNSLL